MTKKYQKHAQRPYKEPSEKYKSLHEEEKDKGQKESRERYQTFKEEEKEKTVSIIVNVIKILLTNRKRI